ncbi:extracellular solute-binding protein [Ectobacillus panaciterrae]|uniref:extracellular solute-binding protein n=1 Tax=Ectobacillus panaciterrae TaxID=363872 RepID=UPI0004246CB1|nr:extracellular solute-binding protein [Ectobacillus panaciterrae]
MKKALSLLTISVLAASMLVACESKDGDKKAAGDKDAADKTLIVWEDKDKKIGLMSAVAKFEKENNVTIKVKEISMKKQLKLLRLDGPAGTGADVFTIPYDQIGGAVTEGLISELKVDSSVTNKYTESAIQAETYNGKLYGLPKAIETAVFIYNKKLMPNAPATMDEVYNFAKGFTKNGNYGFLAPWNNFYFAYGPIGGFGGYVFEQKDGIYDPTKLGVNNDGAVTGADYIRKWYKEGLFPKEIIGEKGGTQMDDLFTSGKAASMISNRWSFPYKAANIDYGVAPLPKLPNGEPQKSFIGVTGWHVSSYSKNKDLAVKFVEFITNEENAKIRFEKTKEIPPIKALANDPSIAEDPGVKAVAAQSKYAVLMPNNLEMDKVWKPANDALQLIVTGKSEPKRALDEAVKQIGTNIKINY